MPRIPYIFHVEGGEVREDRRISVECLLFELIMAGELDTMLGLHFKEVKARVAILTRDSKCGSRWRRAVTFFDCSLGIVEAE